MKNYHYFEYWRHKIAADNTNLQDETSYNTWKQ
jgi:hypothetical protein